MPRKLNSPISVLSKALSHAMLVLDSELLVEDDPIIFAMFPQYWSDTSLGFCSGYAGQAMTLAYSIVLTDNRKYIVYFDGRPAYSIIRPHHSFFEDVNHGRLKRVIDSTHYVHSDDPNSKLEHF